MTNILLFKQLHSNSSQCWQQNNSLYHSKVAFRFSRVPLCFKVTSFLDNPNLRNADVVEKWVCNQHYPLVIVAAGDRLWQSHASFSWLCYFPAQKALLCRMETGVNFTLTHTFACLSTQSTVSLLKLKWGLIVMPNMANFSWPTEFKKLW